MNQTWQKACDCKDATATSGRGVTVLIRSWPRVRYGVAYHSGPICDSCDTPWILVDTSSPSPGKVSR